CSQTGNGLSLSVYLGSTRAGLAHSQRWLALATWLSFATLAVLTLAACSHSSDPAKPKADPGSAPTPTPSSSAASSAPPSFVRYPGQAGAIEPWVQEQ